MKKIVLLIFPLFLFFTCKNAEIKTIPEIKAENTQVEEQKNNAVDTLWIEKMKTLSVKEQQNDKKLIIQFFKTIKAKRALTLEDYFYFFDMSCEFEENCFFQLCCEENNKERNDECSNIYDKRLQMNRKEASSFFLQILREKLFFFHDCKHIKYVGTTYDSNYYKIIDSKNNIVYFSIGELNKGEKTIYTIYDGHKISLIGFLKKPKCF